MSMGHSLTSRVYTLSYNVVWCRVALLQTESGRYERLAVAEWICVRCIMDVETEVDMLHLRSKWKIILDSWYLQ